MENFKPSEYQMAALDALYKTQDNLMVSAVAGSGKTTLLRLMAAGIKAQDKNARILYLAFNNEICSSVTPKLAAYGVEVKTFHKYANAAIRSNRGKGSRVQKYKYINRMKDLEIDDQFLPLNVYQLAKILDVIRLWYVKPTSETVYDAIVHWDIEVSDEWIADNLEPLVSAVRDLLSWGMNLDSSKNQIDFADMLTIPVRNNYQFESYDYILVDEAQDLSPIMHKILMKAHWSGSRIVAVGDRSQAIYGFAGSDLDSFDNLKTLLMATELPLNLCYRCPESVIKLAQKYVSEIEGTGKEGLVTSETVNEMLSSMNPGNLIISRTNAPLVKYALKGLAMNKRVIIRGRQFGENLLSYIKNVESSDLDDFLNELTQIIAKKQEFARSQSRIEMLHDTYDCFESLVESGNYSTVKELQQGINSLFSDNTPINSIVFSSFHRSKGLENPKVYVLEGKKGLTSPGLGQESNLVYVAFTRAQNELVIVKE